MADDVLTILDDDRYERFQLIGWWDQNRLRNGRVLVVGAGALGNEVLKNLALLGIGHVYVLDMDNVENSNLSRSVLFRAADNGRPKADVAAARTRELNPDIRVTAVTGNVLTDVGLGVFRSADVVIGCLDNREARLWVNRCCWKAGRPWVDGGIQEISGVVKVFDPRAAGTACYECGMTANDYRLINLRYSCPLLRREDLLEGKVPTAPTIASMIAGMQVQEMLKLLHGLPVAAGKAVVFNGHANSLYTTAYQVKEDCLSHEHWGDPTSLPLARTATAAELFAALRKTIPAAGRAGRLVLRLERDLVTGLDCGACGLKREVFRPRVRVGLKEADCPACGKQCRPVMISAVGEGDLFAGRSLAELGIPARDMVMVEDAGGDDRGPEWEAGAWVVELAGDAVGW